MFKQSDTVSRISKERRAMYSCRISSGASLQSEAYAKEDALRIYNWYKEKHRRVTVFPFYHDCRLSISRYIQKSPIYLSCADIFEKSPI